MPILPSIEIKPETNMEEAAKTIGYPVLVKASAGGGGKGMRVVESPDTLNAAIESAQREAKNAFGDEKVFLEKMARVGQTRRGANCRGQAWKHSSLLRESVQYRDGIKKSLRKRPLQLSMKYFVRHSGKQQ